MFRSFVSRFKRISYSNPISTPPSTATTTTATTASQQTTKSKGYSTIQEVKEIFQSFLVAFIGLTALSNYISGTICIGPSMEPTIDTRGEVGIVEKITYPMSEYKNIQVGDIVIAVCPTDPSKRVCKRIRALPGQVIIRQAGYMRELVRIPEGHVWLAGDNPENSTDSRNYGPVPIGLIVGRVFLKFNRKNFPFVEWVSRESPEEILQKNKENELKKQEKNITTVEEEGKEVKESKENNEEEEGQAVRKPVVLTPEQQLQVQEANNIYSQSAHDPTTLDVISPESTK